MVTPEGIDQELTRLRDRLDQMTAAVVATVDGLLVTHEGMAEDAQTIAAMSAAQLGLGRQLAAMSATGDFRESVTATSGGYIATFAAGPNALLTIVAGPDLNVGRLHHEARPAADRIGALVRYPQKDI
ncbi:MAG TPA: roadblock/LC7 domain-containing protein [Candidatus Limnocylindrales bacterium]